eukprot:TRINITY_DN398_c0_g2_i5.p1 TRINITY_DN398_c0_g2~~TRINITY_DN398_c0_g2_i5.p1  ORF type:complete len:479 (-),score=79.39 TRINITY_DN398_c0_g2_i5:458-1894(-)
MALCGLVKTNLKKRICYLPALLLLILGPLTLIPGGPSGRIFLPTTPLLPMPPSDGGVVTFEDQGRKEQAADAWDEDKVVQLIRSLVHPRLSERYKYDVCIVTVVRNEYYLKEFLVRALLAGVQMIFLNDDSFQPWDTNITNLIRPFVRAGVVEWRVRNREKRAELQQNQEMRDDWLQAVSLDRGRDCTWMARLDSDEIVYPVDYPNMRLPAWLKENEYKYCEIRLFWVHPYSEAYSHSHGNKLGETLMEAYPRMCFKHLLPKNFVQYHSLNLINSNVHLSVDHNNLKLRSVWPLKVYDTVNVPDTDPSPHPPHPILIHYYTKSLEDFLVKKEQSMAPVWRLFKDYYDGGRQGCWLNKEPFPYSPQYVADVKRVMSVQFTEDPRQDSAGEIFKHPTMQRGQSGDDSDDDLYVFVKNQLEEGKWFDQSCYLKKYPDVVDMVRNGTFADPLIHFAAVSFDEGKTSCWEGGAEVTSPPKVGT